MDLSHDIQEKVTFWLSNSQIAPESKAEIQTLLDQHDEKEIVDRFYRELDFGTGGLRGIIGAGNNRVNIYTIRKATQGLADYIKIQGRGENSVAIGFDSRRYSDIFAQEAASVFAANGIHCYLFSKLTPVPLLSFAVRETQSIAGISITASHNPKEYNGYKVYWEDGCQVIPPHDKNIIQHVNNIHTFDQIKRMAFHDAVEAGKVTRLDKEMNQKYYDAVLPLKVNPQFDPHIKIVYTAIHGSGNVPVRELLSQWGFTNVHVVQEQENPDPEFSTVSHPNPEDPAALDLAVQLAKRIDADIVMGTDPDCDRLAVVVNNDNNYNYLNGNQVGSLLTNYLLTSLSKAGRLPKNPMLIKTIVTSDLGAEIAKRHGVTVHETLTGFKYIGELINKYQDIEKSGQFVIGYEESYGYLIGTHARDKDAVISAALVAEMAAFYKMKNSNLVKELNHIYQSYGFYLEDLKTMTYKGKEGAEKIQAIMHQIRENPPLKLNDLPLTALSDYQTGFATTYNDQQEILDKVQLPLPSSNVLALKYGNDIKITARPSGTEPKIKYYFQCKGLDLETSQKTLEAAMQDFLFLVNPK